MKYRKGQNYIKISNLSHLESALISPSPRSWLGLITISLRELRKLRTKYPDGRGFPLYIAPYRKGVKLFPTPNGSGEIRIYYSSFHEL